MLMDEKSYLKYKNFSGTLFLPLFHVSFYGIYFKECESDICFKKATQK